MFHELRVRRLCPQQSSLNLPFFSWRFMQFILAVNLGTPTVPLQSSSGSSLTKSPFLPHTCCTLIPHFYTSKCQFPLMSWFSQFPSSSIKEVPSLLYFGLSTSASPGIHPYGLTWSNIHPCTSPSSWISKFPPTSCTSSSP